MTLFKAQFLRKPIIFLVATMLSVSAMAADFNDTLKLANNGDAKAQSDLGWMYETGNGVSQDYIKAVEWYLKAARQGEA